MALRLVDKQVIVSEIREVAETSLSAAIANYHGLTVEQLTTLRNRARAAGVFLRVVKNTLAKRAVEGTDFECMKSALVGPTILAFSKNEPGAAAKVFKNFLKENEQFKVTALAIGGNLLPAERLDAVASLPTKEEALALLLSVMQAPIVKLARTLNEIPGKLVRVVAAVRDQKK